ncbi:arginine--tRNA ligase [Nocardia arizonensis]|uniref:arginine--tRNA ligase n=1 Tax=Nocardia arizonensis TaxID=1141647 RepID=UPI0009E6AF4E|nr:arginine--tRNA ligase [Nocardia arizonensis]
MRSTRSLSDSVAQAVTEAMSTALPPQVRDRDPLVRRSDHADYQSNVALSLAKTLGRPSRDIGGLVADALAAAKDPVIARCAVSGPGFVNITVPDAVVWSRIAARRADARLGVGLPLAGRRIVVDYSSPNIAKQMHVGHLRTTVIGDALARLLAFLGATVIRQNHLGDWGTQFGMLIQYLDEHPETRWRHDDPDTTITELDTLYRRARAAFDADADFAHRARARVVALQGGDAETVRVWRDLVEESRRSFRSLYERLGVLLEPGDDAAESAYNGDLDAVVEDLTRAGILVHSEGALCVFDPEQSGPESRAPLIVRKADGGYGYAATDLATIRHRVRTLRADTILYVVDARQARHFDMVFATARRAGWLDDSVRTVHICFGTVLGPDGTPFKTRSGANVPLSRLLDSAVARARAVVADKDPTLDEAALAAVAEAAGIGAVKYADLSASRVKDYVFDLDRMVALRGDTGVYLQYAHARIHSILRNAAPADLRAPIDTTLPLYRSERALALLLDDFTHVLADTARAYEPHRLAGYLFTLARTYTEFYENCPVLKAPDPALRANRLALCALTGDTLARGLNLLGIAAPQRL